MGGDREHPGRSVELDDVLTEAAARDKPALARGDKVQGGANSTIHRRRDELDIAVPETEDTNFEDLNSVRGRGEQELAISEPLESIPENLFGKG
eukprot:2252532-Pyramimonas_sp.AAC.1